MNSAKTSVFSNCLIWFGAAVSIAEIMTGTLFAPLGFLKGTSAIILGHIIGCIFLFLAGVIGGKEEKSSMECVKMSFGQKGSLLFSILNIIQLIGWTSIMIFNGAVSASSVLNIGGPWLWSIVIGVLIAIWIIVDIKRLDTINTVSICALFILTLILSIMIFKNNSNASFSETISFGACVELSVAMPISWLPLISDYTRNAKRPVMASAASSITYFVISSWMYFIGMGAAIMSGESDIASIMIKCGLGIAALIVIIFSTVTTTFLDAYSAGVSCVSIHKKTKEKIVALIVCAIGVILAIFAPVGQFEGFLYFIGSVFSPMVAILIVNYFINKKDFSQMEFNITNLVIWLAGFAIYRIFMKIDMPSGSTLPAMIITALISFIINKISILRRK